MAPCQRIAIVICSTRPGRISPVVSQFVWDQIAQQRMVQDNAVQVELLDIASQHLPLYDEPVVPSRCPANDPTPHYTHAHTRAWSARVRQFDAFIFVTPQYNWSVPAALKNALDYLFHEWSGKPAGIVSYGHRGGGKAADHLRQILAGLRMGPVAEPAVALKLLKSAAPDDKVDDSTINLWLEAGEAHHIQAMFEQLLHPLPSTPGGGHRA